jgi:hypothetical protein
MVLISRLYDKSILQKFNAEANRRIYNLRSAKALDLWLIEYHDIWEGKFDNLGCYLQELQKREY